MTSDGKTLWVAVAGFVSGLPPHQASLRLYRRASNGDWLTAPAPLARVNTAYPFSLISHAGKLCLAASRDQGIAVRCRAGQRWLTISTRSVRGLLVDFAASGGRMLLVTIDQDRLWTYQLVGRSLRAVAQPFRVRSALARLGASSGAPLMALREPGPNAAIEVRQLVHRRWRRLGPALRDIGVGPLLGGPVQQGAGVVVPVVQASSDNWPLAFARLTSGHWIRSGPLNKGPGSAQGFLAALGSHVYALWQQDGPFFGKTYLASAHISLLGQGTARPTERTIWKQHTIGPGDLGLAQTPRRIWLLSMRASASDPTRALQVHIDPIAPPS